MRLVLMADFGYPPAGISFANCKWLDAYACPCKIWLRRLSEFDDRWF